MQKLRRYELSFGACTSFSTFVYNAAIMKRILQLLLFVILISFGCTRTKEVPRLDQGAQIEFISPVDFSNFNSSDVLEFKAKISGSLENYSFMQFYVLRIDTDDTLTQGQVVQNGDILASWPNSLPAGKHLIRIVAINHHVSPVEVIESTHHNIFICTLPAIQVTTLSKNDTSITINWSKSVPANFKAYELFVTRTDTAADRAPFPIGKSIAYITDINQTSFTYSDIFFYYKYQFQLRVISQDDCETLSDIKDIEAGTFLSLPGQAYSQPAGPMLFAAARNRIYYQPPGGEPAKNLYIINPEIPAIENSIQLAENTRLLNMKDDESALYLVEKTGPLNYKVRTLNLNTLAFEPDVPVSFSTTVNIHTIQQDRIIYSPSPSEIAVLDPVSGTSSLLLTTNLPEVHTINNGRFIVSAFPDSFYIFTFNSGNFQMTANKKLPSQSGKMNVIHVPGLVAVGNTLYDESFNELAHLSGNLFFIGASANGQYVVSSDNAILNASGLSEIERYGDGFGSRVWFSADNKTLYHLTEGSLNIKWSPAARLFRYPWKK